MIATLKIRILALLAACSLLVASHARAEALYWTVDTAQSYLELSIPTQKVSVGGTPSGSAFFRNQGATSGGWTVGNKAPIAGTIETDYVDFTSIAFNGGAHNLVALNSGSYTPDPANWNGSTFSPANNTAPAAFGGQIGTTQAGILLIVVQDAVRFSIRDVLYDLDSGPLPITAGEFAAGGTSFGVSDAQFAARGNNTFSIPSTLSSLAGSGVDIGGANASGVATVEAPNPLQPNLRKLTLPISVGISIELYDGFVSELTGTAAGVVVAYTLVPEPGSLALCAAALGIFASCAAARRFAGHSRTGKTG